MPDIYMSLTHAEYKQLEEAVRTFTKIETTHTTVDGYYHKSIRLPVGTVIFEFHGPIVKAQEIPAANAEAQEVPQPIEGAKRIFHPDDPASSPATAATAVAQAGSAPTPAYDHSERRTHTQRRQYVDPKRTSDERRVSERRNK